MKIPAALYFSCWSLTSIALLGLGFAALDNDKARIPPLVVFFLKRSLAVSVCHSSSYALVHRFNATNTSITSHLKLSILVFAFLSYIYIASGPLPLRPVLCYTFVATAVLSFFFNTLDSGFFIDFLARSITFSLSVQNDKFFPIFVLVTAFFTAGVAALLNGPSFGPIWPGPEGGLVKKRGVVGYVAPVLASIVFQVLVRFASVSHVVASLCFAGAWMGCVALTMARSDSAVFDLVVSNVLLACENRFGLTGPTWFATGASVVLFWLNLEVRTVRIVRDQDVLW